jgi:hypothetical protein
VEKACFILQPPMIESMKTKHVSRQLLAHMLPSSFFRAHLIEQQTHVLPQFIIDPRGIQEEADEPLETGQELFVWVSLLNVSE